jgi:hypothetical protein
MSAGPILTSTAMAPPAINWAATQSNTILPNKVILIVLLLYFSFTRNEIFIHKDQPSYLGKLLEGYNESYKSQGAQEV